MECGGRLRLPGALDHQGADCPGNETDNKSKSGPAMTCLRHEKGRRLINEPDRRLVRPMGVLLVKKENLVVFAVAILVGIVDVASAVTIVVLVVLGGLTVAVDVVIIRILDAVTVDIVFIGCIVSFAVAVDV